MYIVELCSSQDHQANMVSPMINTLLLTPPGADFQPIPSSGDVSHTIHTYFFRHAYIRL